MNDRIASLSPRQVECLRLVADLKDTQQIAHILKLSPHTVDTYITDATKKLGAPNRRQAAAMLRDYEDRHPPEKLGYEFPGDDRAGPDAPPLPSQSGGEAAGETRSASAVREMPRAYHAEARAPAPLSWWPLPGEDRRPSSIPPLRRLLLILALVLGLGVGVGVGILSVAGAIVVSERPRS